MAGVAQSVNSIALQAQIFSKNGIITSPIFSGIERQIDGVHFDFNALVNPAAINYVQELNAASALPTDSTDSGTPFQGPTVSNQNDQ